MKTTDLEKMKNVIHSYDLSKVMDAFKKNHPDYSEEKLSRIETEFRRFFEVCGSHNVNYGTIDTIDELFHTFILHTKEYVDFCNKAFGEYIHHTPKSIQEEPKLPIMYIRFLIDYTRLFKQVPPFDIWPLSRDLFGNPKGSDDDLCQVISDCLVASDCLIECDPETQPFQPTDCLAGRGE
ncbi:hypothetical protein [Roseibium litorale]|uniref:Uncharacterized protein n=1 Tax=Roseibium litorale TaxID=2803841 RepID=A0ABR9CS78_9HYPH|nr:hypothetical protein [Roseibium litorale]MBD8893260.1 hypothetical protein [Roseibium litorale]